MWLSSVPTVKRDGQVHDGVVNSQIPATSYVFANNGVVTNLYHIQNDMPIEGFRFWIEDITFTNATGPNDTVGAKEFTYFVEETGEELIDGGEGELQSVESVFDNGSSNKSVRKGTYTLSGQRVADDRNLPSGFYIKDGVKIYKK